MTQFAILTGDIVDSSALSAESLKDTMSALDTAAREISGWDGKMTIGFARRGGDGWQIAMDRTALAVRAALYLQAVLRRLAKDRATRIAIAVGDGTLPASAYPDPNEGHGPAFTTSGRLLGTISGQARMAHATGGAEAATLRLADHISQGWTQAQARAMCEMLPPGAGPRAEIAATLGVSRQAVNQALWGAGYPALADALDFLEDSD